MVKSKVFITGMHSGQSPCSGLGIARSIKAAFPDLPVVGVAHWQGSTGFHDTSIDETLVLPIWSQIDDQIFARDIERHLNRGEVWVPALDLEIHWTAENVPAHPLLLSPNRAALSLTEKPEVAAICDLGFHVPEFLPALASDSEIHSFLRHNSWQCWLKSAYHDARRVTSWPEFEKARDLQIRNWKTDRIFLQKHVFGREETIALAAYQGELLGAIHVDKCLLTPDGKTWAGKVNPVDPEFYQQLRAVIRSLGWSGGAEIEYVRDPDGEKWVIEWNPRFPAWIHGGTLAGYNLPGRLIARALGLEIFETKTTHPYFTRVVYEIPVKASVGLPLLPDTTFGAWSMDGKKGAGASVAPIPQLSGALADDEIEDEVYASHSNETIPTEYRQEIDFLAQTFRGESPARVHLPAWTTYQFDRITEMIEAAKSEPRVQIGYSVKTSPTDEHLRAARKRGFLAECISQMEVRRALDCGFKVDEIILNGPGKFWPITQEPIRGLRMLFCDSVEEFERVIKMDRVAQCLGFRIRLPQLTSRFGNSLEDVGEFRRINSCVRAIGARAELGFHFHMPSWAIGVGRWLDGLQSLLLWCRSIEQLTGVPVRHLDLGGGFYPGDLENMEMSLIQDFATEMLPQAREIYFELGRALTQQSEALVSRILDVRRDPIRNKTVEVVVDASIAELPLARVYPHRVFLKQNVAGSYPLSALRKGSARILGRICMEDDILCNQVEIPNTVEVGDLIVFGDAGAYERTMSYEFGRG